MQVAAVVAFYMTAALVVRIFHTIFMDVHNN